MLRYWPLNPKPDYIAQQCNYKVDARISQSPFRYMADTARGFEMLQQILSASTASSDNGRPTALEIVQHIATHPQLWPGRMPAEVEIEITTAPQLALEGTAQRAAAGKRPQMPPEMFEKIVSQLARCDDIRLSLGGFGEPLAHPQIERILRCAHDTGLFGLHVHTDALRLDEQVARLMIETGVDVVSVSLDAFTEQTYARLKGRDCLRQVLANLDKLMEIRNNAGVGRPLIVAEMVKVRENLSELEEFFDGYLRRYGWVVIRGFDDCAGQLPDRTVLHTAPPRRTACKRIFSRMTILANGTVPACEQDLFGKYPFGNAFEQDLADIWRGKKFEALRNSQLAGRFQTQPLCAKCRQWHRP